MQVTKYFMDGYNTARIGGIMLSRYKKQENIEQFEAGYSSVCKDCAVLRKRLGGAEVVYFGTLSECEAKALTLGTKDRQHKYIVVDASTGKEF